MSDKYRYESREVPGGPEVIVASRSAAESYTPSPEAVAISVRSPRSHAAALPDGFGNVLRLSFDDVEEPRPNCEVLSDGDAERIARFLVFNRNAKKLLIHCEAGVSRSAGIKLGIMDALNWTTESDEAAEPGHNKLVRQKVRAAVAKHAKTIRP